MDETGEKEKGVDVSMTHPLDLDTDELIIAVRVRVVLTDIATHLLMQGTGGLPPLCTSGNHPPTGNDEVSTQVVVSTSTLLISSWLDCLLS